MKKCLLATLLTLAFAAACVFSQAGPPGVLSLILTKYLVFDPPYLERKTFATGLKIDYIGVGLLSVGLGFFALTGQRTA